MLNGFLSEDHRRNFEAARDAVRLGTPVQARCGARTRSGGTCRHPPLSGFKRCAKHGGVAAARALRERQVVALAKGEMSVEDFQKEEARRAANRLREVWKKDPWHPGRTLDLGVHEAGFRAELERFGWDVEWIAPFVAEKARWRYRRSMLDRPNPAAWMEFMVDVFPDAVRAAGPAPEGWAGSSAGGIGEAAFTTPDKLSPWSKRRKLDTAPAPAPVAKATKRRPVEEDERAELLGFLLAQREALVSVMKLARGEDDILEIARRHRARLAAPGDRKAMERWLDLVRELNAA